MKQSETKMKEKLELFRLTCALSDLMSIYLSKVPNQEEVQQMKKFFEDQKVMFSRTIIEKSRSYHKRHQMKSSKRRRIQMPPIMEEVQIPIENVEEVQIPIENVEMGPDDDTFCVIL